ncbi:MAG: transmembrane (4fe-4S) cluster-binding oxidoreductase [Bacteroidetes bacterium OLB9]|nr:MAG: transmembrane (4fe-4S) cluster-binding oxidoreductase [Bacteroidetes bacterium OLB9]
MQQIIFILLLGITSYIAYKLYSRIFHNIMMGKPYQYQNTDKNERWRNVLLVAFGQKKMFKKWIPAVFHLFIYVAFLFTQIELIEIIIDGLFGVHRFFAPILGGFYTLLISTIEILSLLAFIATITFLYRRNLLKVPRLVKSELNGWPKLDANLILIGEFLLITGIFTMNGADTVLQGIQPDHYPNTGSLAISSWLGPALFGGLEPEALMLLERFGWWLHLLVVLGFILYLPISKHLHIFLAFPNVYFSKLTPRGQMENMPEIMNEVKSMLGFSTGDEEQVMGEEMPEFGSKDVFDLSWKNILNAYSCTECGRCTEVCPANMTGKKLSPRKVMMDIRDRAEEISRNLRSGDMKYAKTQDNTDIKTLTKDNYDDGKSLFDYITREEIHACTTCNACVEACPVLIDPLEPIMKMRRYEILSESAGPADWVPMFNSIENNGAVWQMSVEREAWRNEA